MNLIQKLINKEDLSEEEVISYMDEIMTGKLDDAKISAFLVALQSKGASIDEIASCAEVMRNHSCRINPNVEKMVDTCGTGGDMSGTFNISTVSAFVVAACGVPVAKHGNRSASSQCGSADVLEHLGVKIDLIPSQVEKCIEEVGIGFMFAPFFHPAMKHVASARKSIAVRTVFNILGPLTNPAGAQHQVIGVYSEKMTETVARVLRKLGAKHALVVHGDGIDELTITGKNKISELINNEIRNYYISPEEYKLKTAEKEKLIGGDVERNSRLFNSILKGRKGPKRDIVVLNSSAALLAANEVACFREGILKARKAIDSGDAYQKLQDLINFTQSQR